MTYKLNSLQKAKVRIVFQHFDLPGDLPFKLHLTASGCVVFERQGTTARSVFTEAADMRQDKREAFIAELKAFAIQYMESRVSRGNVGSFKVAEITVYLKPI